MDSDLQRYLDDLVTLAREVLGTDLVGAYAAGSVGLGAYQAGRSDVDVALVSAGPLTEATKRALVARLRHEALPCPARGLELVAYTGRWPSPAPGARLRGRAEHRIRHAVPVHPRPHRAARRRRPILVRAGSQHPAPERTAAARTAGGETFADLAPADLRHLLVEALSWWLALPTPPDDQPATGTEDAVLGACRALVRHRDGVWLAKVAAGQRLLDTGDRTEVIGRAVAARHGGPPPTGRRPGPSNNGYATRSPRSRYADAAAGFAALGGPTPGQGRGRGGPWAGPTAEPR
ncbi:nucleotidyltransferase domain-containing protein [Micromonospora sp. M12]